MIMRYAVGTGRVDRDPCSDLRGILKSRPKTESFATLLEPARIAVLLRSIDRYGGGMVVRAALRLAPLLFARPGELRKMRWMEISFDDATWTYISTKCDKELTVPLARQSVEILKDLYPLTGCNEYVFVNARGREPICAKTLTLALYNLGYTGDEQTVL